MAEATNGWIAKRLEGTLEAIGWLRGETEAIERAAAALVDRLARGGTIHTAGNGGSAAEALHLAEELIGRYRANRRALRAVCLNADPTALTCIANDFGFERVFARQAEALLDAEDALVVFSTSGRSPNLLEALRVARERGALTVGLLGKDGGPAAAWCDHGLVVPFEDSAHVQEAHQVMMHLFCEAAERAFPA